MANWTHAGLFSGIGGFSLAARWCGWSNLFDVELDPFCRRVLHKNFPSTQLFEDVCSFDGKPFRGRIDVLSGGFPCQPFSTAGKGLGSADDRSLWPQMRRIVSECQPRFVVAENVRGLLHNDAGLAFESVCTDLEAEGYEVQPFLLPAASVGAPHHRDRLWFVAYADRYDGRSVAHVLRRQSDATGRTDAPAYAHGDGQPQPQGGECHVGGRAEHGGESADAGFRLTQPPLRRADDGLSAGVVRATLKAYGNAIVPQVAYEIFRALEAVEAQANG